MKYLIKIGDYAGIAASSLCLVHCLGMPVLIAAFPLLGLSDDHHAFHDVLVIGVTLPVLLALIPGYLAHRDPTALLLGTSGLGAFLAAVFLVGPCLGEYAETIAAVISGALLLSAHLRNHRLCRRCAGAKSYEPLRPRADK